MTSQTDTENHLLPIPGDLSTCVQRALEEDIGHGDITAALVAKEATAQARVITREETLICGRPWFDEVFHQLDPNVDVDWQFTEGEKAGIGQVVCQLGGPAQILLTGERTALNFLQTLSATANTARLFADAVSGTECRILDTRKTIPGLRSAQKYAVRCGGACNHRIGLYDGILIKDNHIAAAGSIEKAITRARSVSDLPIEIEVEDLDQLEQALAAGANIVLLDNFSNELLRQAVSKTRDADGNTKLEASGGYRLEQLRDAAETGVDFISSGALTKNIRAVDLSMRFDFDR